MNTQNNKPSWWDNNLDKKETYDMYLSWIGGVDAPSRVHMQKQIRADGVQSIADFGCGPCIERDGYIKCGYYVDYVGIDSCSIVHANNVSRGINSVHASVENTNLPACSYELSYSRHVFEHLPTYVHALAEMIRVAKKYVIHVFFITPREHEIINYDSQNNLYHNTYAVGDIEAYLNGHVRVHSYKWIPITADETALHITLHSCY
jgi:SAM-dependent methyltransferase